MTDSDREPPIWRNTILWVGFLILVVVAVVTVLIPELQSDTDEEDARSETSSEEPATEE